MHEVVGTAGPSYHRDTVNYTGDAEPAVLHVFDMDGTLLPKTSANIEIARHTGTLEAVLSLENAFALGQIDTWDFARGVFDLWGIVHPETVRNVYRMAPKLRHVRKTVDKIHENGGRAIVITMSPDFFADHFLELGFDAVVASKFPRDHAEPLLLEQILTPRDKPALAWHYCDYFGFAQNSIVAYGDSRSDRPLFEVAQQSIAINADHHVRSIATHIYDGDSLWDAYELANE
ncbi:HAD-IB family phosphatase [Spirillospora sp. NPDC049024]